MGIRGDSDDIRRHQRRWLKKRGRMRREKGRIFCEECSDSGRFYAFSVAVVAVLPLAVY